MRITYEEQLEINQLAQVELENEELLHKDQSEDQVILRTNTSKTTIHLLNLNEDPFLSRKICLPLKEGDNTIGKANKNSVPDIAIDGIGIIEDHCTITVTKASIIIIPNLDSKIAINGHVYTQVTELGHGDFILFGANTYFVLNDPSFDEGLNVDWNNANKKAIVVQMKEVIKRREVAEENTKFNIKSKERLKEKLIQLIPKINEANMICQELGKTNFFYYPVIQIKSKEKPKEYRLVVRLYTNKMKNLFKVIEMKEFIEKYYMIQERFQRYQYGLEESKIIEDDPMEDIKVFGPKIRTEWRLIGQANIYTDSIVNLLDIQNEQTPVIESQGNVIGTFTH